MFMQDYGAQIYVAGIIFHLDGRPRVYDEQGERPAAPGVLHRGRRERVGALTRSSLTRLEFIAANAAGRFASLVTLTYHGEQEPGEDERVRNYRIAKRSKKDLNRFLTSVRKELGAYLWVQEFQVRGVVHYHVMCEGRPMEERIALAWVRATGQLEDLAARKHAVKVDSIRSEEQVRSYLGRYLGKSRQKSLPDGVSAAGRWWGRSKGLKLELKRELVTQGQAERLPRTNACKVARSLRTWLGKRLGFKVRGGAFRDWGGRFAAEAVPVLDALQAFYGTDAQGAAR
jgi:hypothetical protein